MNVVGNMSFKNNLPLRQCWKRFVNIEPKQVSLGALFNEHGLRKAAKGQENWS